MLGCGLVGRRKACCCLFLAYKASWSHSVSTQQFSTLSTALLCNVLSQCKSEIPTEKPYKRRSPQKSWNRSLSSYPTLRVVTWGSTPCSPLIYSRKEGTIQDFWRSLLSSSNSGLFLLGPHPFAGTHLLYRVGHCYKNVTENHSCPYLHSHCKHVSNLPSPTTSRFGPLLLKFFVRRTKQIKGLFYTWHNIPGSMCHSHSYIYLSQIYSYD